MEREEIDMNTNEKHGVHHTLFHHKSAFAKVSVSALLMGAGGLLSIITDIGWLIGDMYHNMLPHHLFVAVFLTIASTLLIVGFIWFYLGVYIFKKKQEHHKPTNCERIHELEMQVKLITAYLNSQGPVHKSSKE